MALQEQSGIRFSKASAQECALLGLDLDELADLRRNYRQRTYLGGLMVAGKGSTFSCIIRNLSSDGQ